MDARMQTYLLWLKQRGMRHPIFKVNAATDANNTAAAAAAAAAASSFATDLLPPAASSRQLAEPEGCLPAETQLSAAASSPADAAVAAAAPTMAATPRRLVALFLVDTRHSTASALEPAEAELFAKMAAAMNLREGEIDMVAALPTLSVRGEINPSPEILSAAQSHLAEVLAKTTPQLVVCFGRLTLKALLGAKAQFRDLAGKDLRLRQAPHCHLLATYHPRDLLRHPENKREAWQHLKRAMAWLGLDRRSQPPQRH